MRRKFFTYFFASIIAAFGLSFQASAQLIDCAECGLPNSPNFLLQTEMSNLTNTGGMTTSAELKVFFENQSSLDLDLTTISFSMVWEGTNLASLTGMTSDAFIGTWIQNTQFFPPAVFVVDNFTTSALSPVKVLDGVTYDRLYEYNHTGSGTPHPPQTIVSGNRIEIMTITMTFDGSQTFSMNSADPNYLLAKANIALVPGECNEACPNINNQWGFDNAGTPMLVNCFRTESAPFPIELTEFTGEAFSGYNELYWETATEINSEWHIIQRSANPENHDWAEVGRVQAAGESFEPVNYSLRDNDPFELTYYRLKSVDFDGQYEYSDIVVLRREAFDDGTFTVYPNPTTATVIVETSFTSKADVVVEVVDAIGRVLSTDVYPDYSGFFQQELNLEHYTAGMYFIRIDNGIERKEAKVVKQ
ncbi:MAG: T9SS type A sorting domain-containing protein [Bacteroidota bacterium]